MVAPIRPPNSACEELDGRPSSQVSRFQTMPPTRPARTISSSAVPPSASSSGFGVPFEFWIFTTALVTVSATSTERKAPTRLRMPERATADLRPQRPGGDRGGHRVRGVVEPVGEVEAQGGDDHQDQNHGFLCHAAIVACRIKWFQKVNFTCLKFRFR